MNEPAKIIESTPMNYRQWIVIAVMVILNALDGFDVLSSAFASPGMTREWGIERSALGVVLSAELVGMGVGSVILGGLADKHGRKNAMLVCLVLMSIGMYLASLANGVTPMIICRFVTGIGIGGMLAATNAVTAESSNLKYRSTAIAAYVAGYPLGAILGGFAASEWLLPDHGWRSIFLFGAVTTAMLIPFVAWLVPETASFHATKGNITGVNATLKTFGKAVLSSLPVRSETAPKPRVMDILSIPKLRQITLLLSFGYMFHTVTFYYILKFGVQIVADYPPGYAASEAATVLIWANIGGFVGSLVFGFIMAKLGIRWPTAIMLLIGSVSVASFGLGRETLSAWQWAAIIAGFFSNAAISGFYAAFARGFPAHARGTGTGFVLGIGRFGAAGSPLLAGALFTWLGNDQLLTVSAIMAIGSLVALAFFLILPEKDGDEILAEAEKEHAAARGQS
jgi:MFS family permease